MYRFFTSIALFSLLVISVPMVCAQDEGADADPGTIWFDWASPGIPGPVSGPAAEAMLRGPLPADADALAERKAIAAEAAGQILSEISQEPYAPSPTPVVLLGKIGIFDTSGTPSDSTGAIGTRRYIEVVNSKVGIYDLSLGLLAQDTLENWWNAPGSFVFDPQVIWDATTNRFYYAGDNVVSNNDNRLAFGFSKTSAPSNATTDWCHYNIFYGSEFPDYPKLGDSRYFTVIGVNVYGHSGFRGSDIIAISKPPAGTTCPDPATLIRGIGKNIKVGTNLAFTPVPANGIDSNATAWVVTSSLFTPATKIGLFKVTRNSTTGAPVIQVTGSAVTAPSYDMPANAPQKDTQFQLDTLDARMTQAVAAIDPGHGNKFAVWTQHTISGGAGARVRWYEIDPVGKTLLQTGNVQNASLYYFNGAIAPDRVVKGATKAYGSNMLLNFNSSSSTTYPAIKMVSKRGISGISAVKTVKSSPGPNIDFSCDPPPGYCRWGDYAAATPDPNAPIGAASGIVWGTSMWTKDGRIVDPSGLSWRTWNWKSQP